MHDRSPLGALEVAILRDLHACTGGQSIRTSSQVAARIGYAPGDVRAAITRLENAQLIHRFDGHRPGSRAYQEHPDVFRHAAAA